MYLCRPVHWTVTFCTANLIRFRGVRLCRLIQGPWLHVMGCLKICWMPQTGTFHGENDDSSEKSKGYPKMSVWTSKIWESIGKPMMNNNQFADTKFWDQPTGPHDVVWDVACTACTVCFAAGQFSVRTRRQGTRWQHAQPHLGAPWHLGLLSLTSQGQENYQCVWRPCTDPRSFSATCGAALVERVTMAETYFFLMHPWREKPLDCQGWWQANPARGQAPASARSCWRLSETRAILSHELRDPAAQQGQYHQDPWHVPTCWTRLRGQRVHGTPMEMACFIM